MVQISIAFFILALIATMLDFKQISGPDVEMLRIVFIVFVALAGILILWGSFVLSLKNYNKLHSYIKKRGYRYA